MKGVLLVSHGEMANGMKDSATLFLGESIEQFDALCLHKTDDPTTFGTKIIEKIQQLDSGDGVIVFADLFGGTPFNQTVPLLNEKVDLISGMNFPMLLEILSRRTFDKISALDEFVTVGQDGIKNAKVAMQSISDSDDE